MTARLVMECKVTDIFVQFVSFLWPVNQQRLFFVINGLVIGTSERDREKEIERERERERWEG